MHDRKTIRYDDKTASRLAPKGHNGRFDLCVAMDGRSVGICKQRKGLRCLIDTNGTTCLLGNFASCLTGSPNHASTNMSLTEADAEATAGPSLSEGGQR